MSSNTLHGCSANSVLGSGLHQMVTSAQAFASLRVFAVILYPAPLKECLHQGSTLFSQDPSPHL